MAEAREALLWGPLSCLQGSGAGSQILRYSRKPASALLRLIERPICFLSRKRERRNTSRTQRQGTPGYCHQQRWRCPAQTPQKILSCPPDSPGQALRRVALLHTVIHGPAPSILWQYRRPGLCHRVLSGGTLTSQEPWPTGGAPHIHTPWAPAQLQGRRWPAEGSLTQGPREG